jgi:transcriptional regulator with XRE-family HTH domain
MADGQHSGGGMSESVSERDEIARRIRTLRKSRGLSLQQLADKSQMSAGYLSEVERGLSEVSGVKLARVAEHLGVSTDYLLAGRGEPAADGSVQIPSALSEAAKVLDLTYARTLRLLAGKESLVARRGSSAERDWTKEDWMEFYEKVEPYL